MLEYVGQLSGDGRLVFIGPDVRLRSAYRVDCVDDGLPAARVVELGKIDIEQVEYATGPGVDGVVVDTGHHRFVVEKGVHVHDVVFTVIVG